MNQKKFLQLADTLFKNYYIKDEQKVLNILQNTKNSSV